jgi:hypothetical protein
MAMTSERLAHPPVVVAMVARERGITGVHTHVRQLLAYLQRAGERAEVVTPHTWGPVGTVVAGTGPGAGLRGPGRPRAGPRAGQRLVVPHGARARPEGRPASVAGAAGSVRGLRPVPGGGQGGPERPDRAAPAGRPRGPLPDLQADRVGGQGPDRTARAGVPVDPRHRTVRGPGGRRARVRVGVGARRAPGVATGGRPRAARRDPQLRQPAHVRRTLGRARRPGDGGQPRVRQEPPLPAPRPRRGQAHGAIATRSTCSARAWSARACSR